jgi:hypothetical protein
MLGLLGLLLPLQAMAFPVMTESVSSDYYWFEDDHTYMYASTVDFYNIEPDTWHDGVWIGNADQMETQLAWSHTLPPNLRVPPDAVLRAKLKIDGEYVDTDGNTVEIQGTLDWDPLEHMWNDNTTYVLTDVDQEGFWNGGFLDISIFAGEYDLRIDEAVLMMDFAYAAVPEPASLLLVGLGIVGVAALRRRAKK